MRYLKLLTLGLFLTVFCCTSDEGAAPCIVEHNLETNEAENVTANSARLTGSISIVSENCEIPPGAQQGFVYATSSTPNIDDNLITDTGTNISATVNGLAAETTYYVRSFVANSAGEHYGNEISFTTGQNNTPINYGINEYSVEFQGYDRDFIVYVPESYTPENPTPVLFVFHGFGESNTSTMNSTGFNLIADQENFIAVYPQGTDFLNIAPHWNVGGFTNGSTTDDVGFVNFLTAYLSEIYSINSDRIYATGMSNGGFMSFLLACQLSDKIAAIASVTGSMTTETLEECSPVREVPVLQIHGTNDAVVPYDGVQAWNTPIEEVLDYWVMNNACSDTPEINTLDDVNLNNNLTVDEIIYNNGTNGTIVKHYKVFGGQHNWFQNADIDSSAIIWEFFSNYDLNGLIN